MGEERKQFTFGGRITALREQHVIEVPAERKHVAERTDMSSRRVRLLEDDTRSPTLAEIGRFAKEYGVTAEVLVKGDVTLEGLLAEAKSNRRRDDVEKGAPVDEGYGNETEGEGDDDDSSEKKVAKGLKP